MTFEVRRSNWRRNGEKCRCKSRQLSAYRHMWSDNKIRELVTVRLPWQHWTKALVWFDDVDISAFHSCVVVDLWQSLSEWHLLLSACVLVYRRENVGAWFTAANVYIYMCVCVCVCVCARVFVCVCVCVLVFHYFQYGTYCQSLTYLPRFTLRKHMAFHAVTRTNQNMVSFDTISKPALKKIGIKSLQP